jgi:Domain of unknown function (DUF4397)
MKNNRNLFLGIAAAVLLTLSACGSDAYDAAVPSFTRVKLYHTVADSTASTVIASVDGGNISLKPGLPDPLAYGGTFPTDSTYLRLTEGTHNFKVIPTSGISTGLAADATLTANAYYSIFAVDTVQLISALVVKDELPAPVQGKIAIRFVNLSPNAPAYDLGVKGGAVINGNIAYKTASDFVQADLPVGNDTLKIEMRAVGGTTAVKSLNIVKPVSGRVFTLVARGYVGTRPKSYAQTLVATNNAR